MTESLVTFFTSQTPLFLISFMGLGVAGLALVFGILIVHRPPKERNRE